MSFWPLSKLTVKSLRPRFSRSETRVPGVARRTVPPGNGIARAERQRIPGRIDMAFPLSRLRRDGGEVEPGPFERPTEAYVALVHHPDDGAVAESRPWSGSLPRQSRTVDAISWLSSASTPLKAATAAGVPLPAAARVRYESRLARR